MASNTDAQEPARAPADHRRQWQLWITVCLLVVFIAIVILLITFAGGSADIWQRRVYVFTGVQAIVFTAVGWLFGREVNLSAVEAANDNAEGAKTDAATARGEAQQLREKLTGAELAAADSRSKQLAVRAAVEGMLAAETQSSSGPRDVGLDARGTNNLQAIKAMLDEIYAK